MKVYNSAGEQVAILASNLGLQTGVTGLKAQELAFIPDSGGAAQLILAGPDILIPWNGQGSGGQLVKGGSYYVTAELVDAYGKTSLFSESVVVIRQDMTVWVEIFNSAGELVRVLNSGASTMGSGVTLSSPVLMPGKSDVTVRFGKLANETATWDGMDSSGHPVSSGNYVLKVHQQSPTGKSVVTSKSVMVVNAPAPSSAPPFAAPNPVMPGAKFLEIFVPGATASSLPGARIHNLAGELVAELSGTQGSPVMRWDLGSGISAGVYIASVRLSETGMKDQLWRLKLAVVR